MATMVRDALHADQVLDRAGDPERDVQLRRHGLPGTADLALHGQPAGVADGTRGRQLGAERLRPAARPRAMCSCALMPRPTATIRSACDRSTACLASWNGASAFCRTPPASMPTAAAAIGAAALALLSGVGPERADLHRRRDAAPAHRHHVGDELPWNIGRANARPSVRSARPTTVGHQRTIQPRRQRGREVAGLVGVRQHHERGDCCATSAAAACTNASGGVEARARRARP